MVQDQSLGIMGVPRYRGCVSPRTGGAAVRPLQLGWGGSVHGDRVCSGDWQRIMNHPLWRELVPGRWPLRTGRAAGHLGRPPS